MSLAIEDIHPLILNVGRCEHDADWNWKDVCSPFMRIYCVMEGTAKVLMPAGVQTLRPGHLYFIPSFTKHSCICDSYFSHYYVHLYEDYMQQQESVLLDEWELPCEVEAEELDCLLMQRLCDMNPHMILPKSDPVSYDNNPTLIQNLLTNKRRPFCDKVESRGIVLQLLSRFLKYASYKVQSRDGRIESAIAYIRQHIFEEINLSVLADQACLSKDHFIRLFKREHGITPLKYITQRKMEKAQLMLVTEDMPVKNVAYALAFDDYSYFCRLFKMVTGITPQEYRNSHLKTY